MIAKLNLHVFTLVQTTIGFGNPCYSERLGELYPISTKLVEAVVSLLGDWKNWNLWFKLSDWLISYRDWSLRGKENIWFVVCNFFWVLGRDYVSAVHIKWGVGGGEPQNPRISHRPRSNICNKLKYLQQVEIFVTSGSICNKWKYQPLAAFKYLQPVEKHQNWYQLEAFNWQNNSEIGRINRTWC